MGDETPEILAEVAGYYSRKVEQHGLTPAGVDWNGVHGQTLRFEQLCRILPDDAGSFSIADLGCGYGALFEYLETMARPFTYTGVDISASMITAARSRFSGAANARFLQASAPDSLSDYTVASGIFNVRQNRRDDVWRNFMEATLQTMNTHSARGFAFNCLTSYSDEDRKRDDLYYADPCWLFDLCKRRFSRDVALLHDYGLYEFTILVRK